MYVSECVASPVTSLQRGGRWEEGGASVPVAVRRQAMLRYEHGLLADAAEVAGRRSVGRRVFGTVEPWTCNNGTSR